MHKITKKAITACALIAATIGVAHSSPAAPSAEVRIPFVNHGMIRDFRVVDRDTLYLRTTNRQWYRAELMGFCRELPWANAIGLDTRYSPSFDRFSAIIVRGERCQLQSLTKADAPPQKLRRSKGSDT